MRRIVPEDWMPAAGPKRVIVHWTAGGASASPLDREHYHLLIEQDLELIRGIHSIRDNDSVADNDYAAHTQGLNTRSIGVSLCGMAGAVERPFDPGPYPITEAQWNRAATVVADLCERYAIPVTPQTVLQHGEVQTLLGVPQKGKWDVCRLPWAASWGHAQVGDNFRARVQACLGLFERPLPIAATVKGVATTGFLEDSQVLIAIRPLEDGKLLKIRQVSSEAARLEFEGRQGTLAFYVIDGKGHVPGKRLAEFLGAGLDWDGSRKRLTIA